MNAFRMLRLVRFSGSSFRPSLHQMMAPFSCVARTIKVIETKLHAIDVHTDKLYLSQSLCDLLKRQAVRKD
jgi:hypothetical protein